MIHGLISWFLTFFVFILYFEFKKILIRRKLRQFDSPKQYPFLGIMGRVIGKPNDQHIDIVLNLWNEVDSTPFDAWFGPLLGVGVSEPEDLQIILTSEHCLNKPYFYDHLHCTTSIIAIDKEIWKPARRQLNTAFNIKMMQSYIPLLNEKSRILVEKAKEHVKEPGDLYRTIFISMMDMVTRTTMGVDLKLQSERGSVMYKIAKLVMHNIQYRIARIWLRWEFTYLLSDVGRKEKVYLDEGNKMFDIAYEMKMNEMKRFESRGIDYLKDAKEANAMNFLERCISLENEGVLSHENVLDQLRVIVLAGTDTSSITTFGTLLMLAINQKHQELVVDELRSIFDSADCDVTQEHLAAMKYTERVIKETMRLLPPVPFIARSVTGDIQLPKGTVPKGAIIFINIMHLHRNPKIWGENVLEFDPDRFLPENIAKRPPFSYIPFSGGSRNCIGMKYALNSAKITLAHMLRRYKYTTDLRYEDIRLNCHLVTEVKNEKPLRVEYRDF